ncbi:AsmA-like C-terminal region-containing protein [Candidatus Latescibacterota bacterium]
MNKTIKILIGAAIFFVAAFALIIILAAVFFPAEKIKSLIEAKASEAIEKPVSIDDIGISFAGIPALKISDIAIGTPGGYEDLYVTVKSLRVKVNIMKLLKKEVEIVSVEMDNPKINMNISDAQNIPASEDNSENSKAVAPMELPMLPVPVTLQTLIIRNGRIEIVNKSDGTVLTIDEISQKLSLDISKDLKSVISTGVLTADDISISLSEPLPTINDLNLRLEYEFSGDLTTGNISISKGNITVNKLPFDFSAVLNNWTQGNFEFKSGNLRAIDLIALVPSSILPEIEKISTGGDIQCVINGSVDMSQLIPVIIYNGRFDVSEMSLSYDDRPENIENINASITFNENDLNIGNFSFGAGNSVFSLSGMIKSYMETPSVSVKMDGQINIGDITGSLPLLEEYDPRGSIEMNVAVQGSPEDPPSMSADGMVSLKAVEFKLPETMNNPATLNGQISISPESLTIENISMISGKTDLNFNGVLSGYMNIAFPENGANASFKGLLKSQIIDIDDLLVKSEEEDISEQSEPLDIEKMLASLPVPPNLSIETGFDLGKITAGKLSADSANGIILFEDGILNLSDLEASAYNGSLGGKTRVNVSDIENVTYDGSFTLNGLDSGAFISGLFDLGDVFEGDLSSSLNFSGAGLDSLSIVKNLKCDGKMRFENGQIKDWEFTNKLGTFLKFLDLGTVEFDTIVNTYSVEDGKFFTPDMSLNTQHGNIRVDGNIGFDTSIDYMVTMFLNKEAAQNASKHLSTLADIIGDDPETLELIVTAGGTLKNPKFGLDTSKAKKQIKEEIKTKAEEFIEEKLNDPDLKEKGKKLLDQLFR